jgi:long-chain fatty acid transport protein
MKKYFALLALMILGATTIHAQNGTRLIGFDAVTSGRGGTATGAFDNPSLVMNNPAGLSFLKTSQADLSVSLMMPRVHFENSINNTFGKNNVFPLGCIGYAGKVNNRLAFGIGVFTQGGMGADFNLDHNLYKDENGDYVQQSYHSKFAVMQAGGSLAYKLNKQLSIGITADLVYGQVEFRMPMAMPPSMLKGVANSQTGSTFGDLFGGPAQLGGLDYSELVASANMKTLTSFGFNGKIGVAYRPNDKWELGINYSLPVKLSYKNGTAEMDMSYQMNDAFGKIVGMLMQQNPGTTMEQAQQMTYNMFTQMGIDLTKGAADKYNAVAKFSLPQSLAIGFSYAASRKVKLLADAEWINWANAFDKMDITLTNGTNPNISTMVGTQGRIAMAFPMYWKNTVVIRTGIEYRLNKKLVLRGGYVYGSNPVPSSTVFAIFPAVVQHHVTAGGSLKLNRSLKLNAAYEYAFRSTEQATATSYVASEYNNSKSSLENHIFHLSISWMMKK